MIIGVEGIHEQKEKYWSTGRSSPGLGWAASVFINGEAVSLLWASPKDHEPHSLLHLVCDTVSKDSVVVDRQARTYLSPVDPSITLVLDAWIRFFEVWEPEV